MSPTSCACGVIIVHSLQRRLNLGATSQLTVNTSHQVSGKSNRFWAGLKSSMAFKRVARVNGWLSTLYGRRGAKTSRPLQFKTSAYKAKTKVYRKTAMPELSTQPPFSSVDVHLSLAV